LAPSLEPLSSTSSLNKKNKYLIRDFLGVENDFHRDDFEKDSDSATDRKQSFLGWSYFDDFWDARHHNVRMWGVFLLVQNILW
tara:strand:+ start:220 stop:468 length:249 start_codon:yes stop_codon:yes gene_type:complete